jgi:hypothetical protein
MNKTIILVGMIVLSFVSLSVNAQQNTWDPKKNPTVDSITTPYKAKLVPMPTPMTIEQIYPVLGQYESSANTDAPSVTISLDPEVKGVVWVEGLPQGKIKAMLRKSPATYKIPVQQTEDGKEIAEGTLIYDKETNSLLISIGKSYNSLDPSAAFTVTEPVVVEEKTVAKSNGKTKTKTKKVAEPKPWTYAGTKVDKGTVMNN